MDDENNFLAPYSNLGKHKVNPIDEEYSKPWWNSLEKNELELQQQLFDACSNGHLDEVIEILNVSKLSDPFKLNCFKLGLPVKTSTGRPLWSNRTRDIKRDNSPFHVAILNEHLDVVKWIIKHDDSIIRHRNNSNQTILHMACEQGHVKLLLELLNEDDSHGSVSSSSDNMWVSVDDLGRTPLFLAAQHGHFECVNILLSHRKLGARMNISSNSGMTPFLIAVANHHFTVARAVYYHYNGDGNYDLDIESSNHNGMKALHFAVNGVGNIEMVDWLLDKCSADPNAMDRLGRTAFFIACRRGNFELVKLLAIKHRVDMTISYSNAFTPAEMVFHNDRVDIHDFIIKLQNDRERETKQSLYYESQLPKRTHFDKSLAQAFLTTDEMEKLDFHLHGCGSPMTAGIKKLLIG